MARLDDRPLRVPPAERLDHVDAAADALAGCLLGQALGDALGFVVEAEPPAVAQAYVTDWLQRGKAAERRRSPFSFGQFSDDTQLARELLLSFRDAGGWDPAVFAGRVADLFRDHRDVGAGPGTRAAAKRLLQGIPWRESGTPAPYAGNGSAMRAGPLGLLFPGAPDEMRRAARDQSRITHLDPRCAAGAVAVSGAVGLAAASHPIDRQEFLKRLSAWVEVEDPSVADAIRNLGSWVDCLPSDAPRYLPEAELDPAHLDRWRGISALVTPSVVWSLYAFLRSPDDYWTTVCTAIGVGGDTDTMAAMAGAISGAHLGVAALPAPLLEHLHDRDGWWAGELQELARACARPLTGR